MTFGIHTGGSVNLSNYYDKAKIDADYEIIDGSIPVTTPAIQPILTSNTNGTVTVSASSEYSAALAAWRAVDGDDSPGAVFATDGPGPHWWQIDFGQRMQCPIIEIQRRKIQSQAPTRFKLKIGETLAGLWLVKEETNLVYSENVIRYKVRFKPYMRYLLIEDMGIEGDPAARIVSLQSVKVLNA